MIAIVEHPCCNPETKYGYHRDREREEYKRRLRHNLTWWIPVETQSGETGDT